MNVSKVCSARASAYGLMLLQPAARSARASSACFLHTTPIQPSGGFRGDSNGYGERRRGRRARERANINHHDAPPAAKMPMWGSWAVADGGGGGGDGGGDGDGNVETGGEEGGLKMPVWATSAAAPRGGGAETVPAMQSGQSASRRRGWGELAGAAGCGAAGPQQQHQGAVVPTDVAGRKVRLEEAAKVLREGLVQRHSGTLQNKSNYAAVLEGQGKLAQAAELYREVVEGCNRSLGPTNLSTLTAKNNLATVLFEHFREQGCSAGLRESAELFGELHATQVEELGPAHPHTLAAHQKWEAAVAMMGGNGNGNGDGE